MNRRPLLLGAASFCALVLVRNTGFWGFLLRQPSALGRIVPGALFFDALLPLAAAAAAAGGAYLLARRAAGLGKGPETRGLSVPEGLLAGVLAFCAWNALIAALAPPTEWDVLAYHLALPKLYLRGGLLREIPWMLHSHWPHLMELLYTPLLALGKDQYPALLHAAVCGFWVWAVFETARRQVGAGAAWAAAALLASQPAVLRTAGTAHSDGGLSLFYLLSCLAVWRWAQGRDRRWLLAGGAFAGLAASCKLHGAALILLTALWICLSAPERSVRERLRSAAIFAACAAAIVLPWYLKTWAGTGNPVWPFLSSVLGGKWGAAAVEGRYIRSNLLGWPPDPGLVFRYGPQYLLLPALGSWAWVRSRGERLPPLLVFLLLPALPYFLLVARHHEGWRFFLPFYPALALTAGWAFSRTSGRERWAASLLLAFGLVPAMAASQNNRLFAVAALRPRGERTVSVRDAYLRRTLDHYAFFKEASGMLGPGDKVLLFREIRGYYLDADYMWGDPLNQGLVDYARLAGPAALGARLDKLGVTHVLINEGLAMYGGSEDYYDKRTLALMRGLLKARGRPVLARGALRLYAI